jgi:hypothetical protein
MVKKSARAALVFLFWCATGTQETYSVGQNPSNHPWANAKQDSPTGLPPVVGAGVAKARGCELAQRGPAIPNEATLFGQVIHVEPIQSARLGIAPPQLLFALRVRILKIEDAPGASNPLTGREGTDLDAYSKEPLGQDLVGKEIRGVVAYRGDEHGGMYWIHSVHVSSRD